MSATTKCTRHRYESPTQDGVYFFELEIDRCKVTWIRGVDSASGRAIHHRGGERAASEDAAARVVATLQRELMHRYQTHQRFEQAAQPDASPAAVVASNPVLEAEVLAAPDGTAAVASSVYADWLQTQGDPRGELAALFLSGRDHEAHDWLARHPRWIVGDLDLKLGSELYDLVWHHGFLAGASLKHAQYYSPIPLAELAARLLALPGARLVTQLRFGLASYDADNDWSNTLAAIVRAPQAAQLRALQFDDYDAEDCDISDVAFGDFSRDLSRLRALEVLAIRAGRGGTLGAIDLPRLRRFVRVSGGLERNEIDDIIAARWPRLEHLEVWFGDPAYGAVGTVTDALALIERAPPTLTSLSICNCAFVHQLLEPLAKSPRVRQLTHLDLSCGVLMDGDLDPLVAHADAFVHLARLDLTGNQIVERSDEIVRALPNAIVDHQRHSADGRYVALGE